MVAAARNGAKVVLHHLGDSTQKDVDAVAAEIDVIGSKSVIVGGDISDPETAQAVGSPFPAQLQSGYPYHLSCHVFTFFLFLRLSKPPSPPSPESISSSPMPESVHSRHFSPFPIPYTPRPSTSTSPAHSTSLKQSQIKCPPNRQTLRDTGVV
jgi:hypothetical protein